MKRYEPTCDNHCNRYPVPGTRCIYTRLSVHAVLSSFYVFFFFFRASKNFWSCCVNAIRRIWMRSQLLKKRKIITSSWQQQQQRNKLCVCVCVCPWQSINHEHDDHNNDDDDWPLPNLCWAQMPFAMMRHSSSPPPPSRHRVDIEM